MNGKFQITIRDLERNEDILLEEVTYLSFDLVNNVPPFFAGGKQIGWGNGNLSLSISGNRTVPMEIIKEV